MQTRADFLFACVLAAVLIFIHPALADDPVPAAKPGGAATDGPLHPGPGRPGDAVGAR